MKIRHHFAAMFVASAVLLALPSVTQAVITWDFGNNTLNGWTVLTGAHNFSGNGISASTSGTSFAHDAGHPTLLVESPAFNFTGGDGVTGGVAMRVGTEGGQGAQGGSTGNPANPAAVTSFNGGNSATNGLKGVGLLNTSTGNYDDFFYDPGNGGPNPDFVGRNAATLTGNGVNLAQQYRLHIYEHDQGSWGWTRFNVIEVDGAFGPVTDEVAGNNNITPPDALTGTQSNEVFGGAPVGRFVRLYKDNPVDGRLHVSELEVFSGVTPDDAGAGFFSGGNLSNNDIPLTPEGEANNTGPPGTTTSLEHGGPAANAMDNQVEGGGSVWSTNLISAADPQLTGDTGGTQAITTVRAFPRNDTCCTNRWQNLAIQVYADDGGGNPGALVSTTLVPAPGGNNMIDVALAALVSADLSAQLQPFNAGLGYTYVFELGDFGAADSIEVDNPNAGVFTTFLDVNNADIVVEYLPGSPLGLTSGTGYQLLKADNITGTYNSLTLPLLPSGFEFDTSQFLSTGFIFAVLAIPEPSSLPLAAMGLLGLLAITGRRRRRRN